MNAVSKPKSCSLSVWIHDVCTDIELYFLTLDIWWYCDGLRCVTKSPSRTINIDQYLRRALRADKFKPPYCNSGLAASLVSILKKNAEDAFRILRIGRNRKTESVSIEIVSEM